MTPVDDTIAAIASAPGGAMRGLVRVSGPHVVECLEQCFLAGTDVSLSSIREPAVVAGRLSLGPPLGEVPADVYLWPTSKSYTRQPVAEIHTFGSPPIVGAVLRAVCAAGARLAQPGEFTMRAFLAGRLDLTQAEAVLGVIDATGERQLEVALSQLAGGLAGPLGRLREHLLDTLAHLEAGLDFADEEIEFVSTEELIDRLADAQDVLTQIETQMRSRGAAAPEVRIVFAGAPNVGKSSLLNALACDPVAIVSPTAGTTRDYVTRRVQLGSLACLLVDTAGVEAQPPACDVAAAAQRMAKEQYEQAQLQLFCIDATRPLCDWERCHLADDPPTDRLVVLTKIDAKRATDLGRAAVETSSKTGQGLAELRRQIVRALATSSYQHGAVVAETAARCHESVSDAAESLARAREVAMAHEGEELVAVELRGALDHLGRVVGAVYTDDVLDRIFSRFCIGK